MIGFILIIKPQEQNWIKYWRKNFSGSVDHPCILQFLIAGHNPFGLIFNRGMKRVLKNDNVKYVGIIHPDNYFVRGSRWMSNLVGQLNKYQIVSPINNEYGQNNTNTIFIANRDIINFELSETEYNYKKTQEELKNKLGYIPKIIPESIIVNKYDWYNPPIVDWGRIQEWTAIPSYIDLEKMIKLEEKERIDAIY